MKKVISILLIALLLLAGGYLLWSRLDRTAVPASPELYLDDLSSYGVENGRGNLVGIQPYMEVADYASPAAFQAKLGGYLAAVDAQGWLQPDTIVIFPEFIGTWLVLANEKQDLYQTQTLEEAMQLMVESNVPAFASAYAQATGQDKIRDSLFRMKAEVMAGIYTDTFSTLAEKYGVTIVGGSLILPEPSLENGQLLVGEGGLQNVSLVFQPDGRPYPAIIRKVFLTDDEQAFLSPGVVEDLSTFVTPAGKLGVLICADSWFPQAYAQLADEQPAIIAVPNNFISTEGWDEIWRGYQGPTPADVDPADIGRITEGEARLKYTLHGRMQQASAQTGMHVFFRGSIWDMTSHGHTIIFAGDDVIEAAPEARGAVVNYWLP